MLGARFLLIAAMLLLPLAGTLCAAEYVLDDGEPPVTDRVARISFIRGDVQVKRNDSDIWEKAVLNLPLVEGDEITTGADSRFEIQFDTAKHLRVNENSFLKITALQDNGIAVSLSEGTASLTISKFASDNEFFEIDAPKTTVAVQKTGRYRVDAGKAGDNEIRVSIADDGEARVYSAGSGFTLRDGRSARIYIDGNFAGEWETADTARYVDEFDTWALDRDSIIAKRLRDSHYGQYYDQDIYGADELNDHGQWFHTRDYGYVWRPFATSINIYNDWSPYRYGHWRWLPAFGWTWVNDEPWGWATYHHGRWIWYRGGWHWSPYSYYRHRRSWWYPALVVLRIINRNVCWYPLPYHYAYYNFNRHYQTGRTRTWRRPQDTSTAAAPTIPVPEPRHKNPPPATAVVTVPVNDFGRVRGGVKKVSARLAATIVRDEPKRDEPLALPSRQDVSAKAASDIRVSVPSTRSISPISQTGAAKRDIGKPLDRDLRDKIVFGNRPAVIPPIEEPTGARQTSPPTGAVQRRVIPAPNPVFREPQRPAAKEEPGRDRPVVREPQRRINQRPSNSPTVRNEDPSLTREEPRNDPSHRAVPREPVRRNDPPAQKEPSRRSTPTRSEPRKSDPAPQKSAPSKPAPSRPAASDKARSKDSR